MKTTARRAQRRLRAQAAADVEDDLPALTTATARTDGADALPVSTTPSSADHGTHTPVTVAPESAFVTSTTVAAENLQLAAPPLRAATPPQLSEEPPLHAPAPVVSSWWGGAWGGVVAAASGLGSTIADRVIDVLDAVEGNLGAASPAQPTLSLSAALAEARSAPEPTMAPVVPVVPAAPASTLTLQDLFASVTAPVFDVVESLGKSAFHVMGAADLTAAKSQRAGVGPYFSACFEDTGAASFAALELLSESTARKIDEKLQASHTSVAAFASASDTLADILMLTDELETGHGDAALLNALCSLVTAPLPVVAVAVAQAHCRAWLQTVRSGPAVVEALPALHSEMVAHLANVTAAFVGVLKLLAEHLMVEYAAASVDALPCDGLAAQAHSQAQAAVVRHAALCVCGVLSNLAADAKAGIYLRLDASLMSSDQNSVNGAGAASAPLQVQPYIAALWRQCTAARATVQDAAELMTPIMIASWPLNIV